MQSEFLDQEIIEAVKKKYPSAIAMLCKDCVKIAVFKIELGKMKILGEGKNSVLAWRDTYRNMHQQ